MTERMATPLTLLAGFADYYQSVADSRRAIDEGRLGAMLSIGGETPPSEPGDLAARLSARLAAALRQQEKMVSRSNDPIEIEAHRKTMYIMAAVTDEIFILDVDWSGRDAWIGVLLEYNLFQSRNAGNRFFEMADELLAEKDHDILKVDVAAVLLMALQLGFKGRYRGARSDVELDAVRGRLSRFIERRQGTPTAEIAFPQTMDGRMTDGTPQRIAPLSPWYTAAAVVLIVHVAVSSLVWLWLLEPFRRTVGSG
jgi:type VI secretion system protein ImpK